MTDLITFVRARLDEREAIAKAVADYNGHEWTPNHLRDDEDAWVVNLREGSDGHERSYPVTEDVTDDAADFIAANDPAYVLRDTAAKRAIVAAYEDWQREADEMYDCRLPAERVYALRDAVKHLAAIDSGHPDYNPEWRLT